MKKHISNAANKKTLVNLHEKSMHRSEKNSQGTDFLSLEACILETYGKFKILKIFILDGKLQNKTWTGN